MGFLTLFKFSIFGGMGGANTVFSSLFVVLELCYVLASVLYQFFIVVVSHSLL